MPILELLRNSLRSYPELNLLEKLAIKTNQIYFASYPGSVSNLSPHISPIMAISRSAGLE